MKIRTSDDRMFEGTPKQIIQSMRAIAFDPMVSLDAYLEWLAPRVDFELPVGSIEERCAALLDAMIKRGMATRVADLHLVGAPERNDGPACGACGATRHSDPCEHCGEPVKP